MKLLSFLVILTFSLVACDNKSPQYLFPYTIKDSVISQTLSHDSLVLAFAEKPAGEKWFVEYGIYGNTGNEEITGNSLPVFEVKNNRIAIPVHIPDSINTDTLFVFLRAAPEDGLYFEKIPGGYKFFAPPRYMQQADHRQHLIPTARSRNLYRIPDSLINGPDSAYYHKKVQEFLRDSLWQHDPLPAAPGQI